MESYYTPPPDEEPAVEVAPMYRRRVKLDIWRHARFGWGLRNFEADVFTKMAVVLESSGIKSGQVILRRRRLRGSWSQYRITLWHDCTVTEKVIEQIYAKLDEASEAIITEHPKVLDVTLSTAYLDPPTIKPAQPLDPVTVFGLLATAATDERLGDSRPTAKEIVDFAELITGTPRSPAT